MEDVREPLGVFACSISSVPSLKAALTHVLTPPSLPPSFPPFLPSSPPHSAKVWDAITGAELHTFTHKHIVKTVEFSPDSRKFVSGGHEGKLRLFDLVEPEAPPMVIDLPSSSSGGTTLITKVIWDRADSNRVITGTSDGKVRAWDLRSRQETQSAEVQGEERGREGGREGRLAVIVSTPSEYFAQ